MTKNSIFFYSTLHQFLLQHLNRPSGSGRPPLTAARPYLGDFDKLGAGDFLKDGLVAKQQLTRPVQSLVFLQIT